MLAAAAGCVLVALRVLPTISPPSDLGPPPTVIVNDTAAAVVAVHCVGACPSGDGATIQPGSEHRAGPPSGRWEIRAASGALVGCLAAHRAGERMMVSQAPPCP
jgi:hypothetical protein